MDLNKKPIFLAAYFAPEEMCSFQDRSDATEAPNMDRLSHIFRVFEENIREIFIFALLSICNLVFNNKTVKAIVII